MRAVVQRVASARVEVEGEDGRTPDGSGRNVTVVGAIDRGLLAYVGFGRGDTEEDRAWVLSRIATLRVFADDAGKMSLGVQDIGGAVLLVSQFTLYGDVRRGRRPSFDDAMPPEEAQQAYEAAVREARALGLRVETGRFRAEMRVHSCNDGPVTIWIDSALRGRTHVGRGGGRVGK